MSNADAKQPFRPMNRMLRLKRRHERRVTKQKLHAGNWQGETSE